MIKKYVPKDLSKYKTKVFASLTLRQIVCIGIASLFILFSYFLICKPLGFSKNVSIFVCMFPGIIALSFTFSVNDMALEKYLSTLFKWNVLIPAKRKIKHIIWEDDFPVEKHTKKRKNVPDKYKPYL